MEDGSGSEYFISYCRHFLGVYYQYYLSCTSDMNITFAIPPFDMLLAAINIHALENAE